MRRVIGNKYKLSLKNLFFKKNSLIDNENDDDEMERSFFCSELVAKAYKKVGILDN